MVYNDYVVALITLGTAVLVAGVVAWLAMLIVERLLNNRVADGEINWRQMRRPAVMTAVALAVYGILPTTTRGLSDDTVALLTHAMSIIAIVGVGWLILTITDAVGQVVGNAWDINKEDNRHERSMITKFRVLRRVWIAIVAVCTVGAVLMTFPSIRSLGAGLLASAGVAGIVLGIALRPTLETFLASLQVALTEPISIDDVVIVEGEWGRIEEIRPTYVVVKIWDDRRLIVPLTYFISQPFQNWTRTRSDITGVVTLKLDFRTPIEQVREKVGGLVTDNENYDGRFWNVQITETDDRTMTLRVLCTAADASKAWNLRCEVREKLITWLQAEHPVALPRVRASVEAGASGTGQGPGDGSGVEQSGEVSG